MIRYLIASLALGACLVGPACAQSSSQLEKLERAAAAAAATSMPGSCEAPMLQDDVRQNLPGVLGLGPNAATIVSVHYVGGESLYKTPRGGDVIECYLEVHWSNGLMTPGTFKEWQDQYGQVDVGWQAAPGTD